MIGMRMPARLSENVKLTPNMATRLNVGEPSKSPRASKSDFWNEKSKSNAISGEIMIIGQHTEIQ